MWGRPPFFIGNNYAIDVRNLVDSRNWYAEKLRFREAHDRKEDDSGRPFADLHIGNDDTFVSLVELPPGASAEDRHVIFFAKNLEKAHQWLAARGVLVEPITSDSGGNRLFRFHDLEGNPIEVCVEPGQRPRNAVIVKVDLGEGTLPVIRLAGHNRRGHTSGRINWKFKRCVTELWP